jgi:hypothetical protein
MASSRPLAPGGLAAGDGVLWVIDQWATRRDRGVRERKARGLPTVFGPRHRKRVRWLAKDPPPQARERAEAWTEPRAERREA